RKHLVAERNKGQLIRRAGRHHVHSTLETPGTPMPKDSPRNVGHLQVGVGENDELPTQSRGSKQPARQRVTLPFPVEKTGEGSFRREGDLAETLQCARSRGSPRRSERLTCGCVLCRTRMLRGRAKP